MSDAASILFPNDVKPAPEPPAYYKAQTAAAEQRLMRRAEPDDAAGRLFPADTQRGPEGARRDDPARPAGSVDADDIADKLFGSTVDAVDYEKAVSAELDTFTMAAIQDGDTERADALKHATSALADDMRAAGTDAGALSEAFQIVQQSAGMTEMTHDQREASYNSGMTAVQEAGISDAELSAARAFIKDLDRVSPGVIDSLRAHGAGNDIRLIKKACAEAARRGYR